MTRVKKGMHALKTRRNILKMAKGFRHGRSTKEKLAYEQLAHSWASAFIHRRDKKGNDFSIWKISLPFFQIFIKPLCMFLVTFPRKNLRINAV